MMHILKRSRLVVNLNNRIKTISSSSNYMLQSDSFLYPFTSVQQLNGVNRKLSSEAINHTDSPEQNLITSLLNVTQNKSILDRQQKIQETWKYVNEKHKNEITPSVYNTYIQLCTQNNVTVNYKAFVKDANDNLNRNSYLLLVENICESGDVRSISELLEIMKDKGIPADESIFNAIVMGHIINSGIEGGKPILNTMKTAQIPITNNTHWSIIKGLIKWGDKEQFKNYLKTAPKLSFEESWFHTILLNMGISGNHKWFSMFSDFLQISYLSRQYVPGVENVCFDLVSRGSSIAAFEFYKKLVEPTAEGDYAMHLLQEMLLTQTPIQTIIDICKELESSQLNEKAFTEITRIALENELIEEALQLFDSLKELRPHYFWPILMNRGQSFGGAGILDVLIKMNERSVVPDDETLTFYVLPYMETEDVDALLQKFLPIENLKMRNLMTPIIYNLLHNNRLKETKSFCEKQDIAINGEKVMKQLTLAWKNSGDSESASYVLQKICETNNDLTDWCGKFVLMCLKLCRSKEQYVEFLKLIKIVHKSKLRMSSLTSDHIFHHLKYKAKSCNNKEEIESVLDQMLDVSKMENLQITHPRDMNLEELECHLIELQNKNMDLRGVMRRLIQEHSGAGNHKRVEELRQEFIELGYNESPGMRASLMSTYIQNGNAQRAKELFQVIKRASPEFRIDSFKIIDLATLLVTDNEIDEALAILSSETCGMRDKSTHTKNCRKLLAAAKQPEHAWSIFNVLLSNGYCHPTNTILGPLVRVYMKNDLAQAVETYCKFAKSYKCTPLQLELLCEVIDKQDENLLQKVTNATVSVHGVYATNMTLLAAFAEKGLKNVLTKYLTELPTIRNIDIEKRCQRWIQEDKLLPLETLLAAAKRLPKATLNRTPIELAIIKIYGSRKDCEGAANFWRTVERTNDEINPVVPKEVLNLLKRYNFDIPESLLCYQR